jgi:hypothetical protein
LITGAQIRAARKLLGWHRGMVAIRGRGITGNTVGKAEGAYPGKPPTPEQLAEIKAVLEAAGIEFTNGDEPEAKCDDGAEGELISASCGAVLDDPLDDLSNNHPKQDPDCEEQPFARKSRGSGFPACEGPARVCAAREAPLPSFESVRRLA